MDAKRQRAAKRRIDPDRVAGGFAALPWDVMDSPAYLQLSFPAKVLLFELARQYGPGWNGRLLLTMKKMKLRGWTSSDVLCRAKRELLEAGFIVEMVKGRRPRVASWYAVTWYSLAPDDPMNPKYDAGMEHVFRRGMYRDSVRLKNTRLIPGRGAETGPTAPASG